MKRLLVAIAALLALTGCTPLPTVTIDFGASEAVSSATPKTQDDQFAETYTLLFLEELGTVPDDGVLYTARELGKQVCGAYALGATSDDMVKMVVENTDEGVSRTGAIIAMAAGMAVYCPQYQER